MLPPVGRGKRALIVVQGVPHPSEGASTVLFYWYIAALHAAEFEILNVLLLGAGAAAEDAQLAAYKKITGGWRRFTILTCRSRKFVVPRMRGLRFDDAALAPAVAGVREFKPDIILCLDITGAMAARAWPGTKIVWLGDLAFQTGWYHALYAYKERRASLRLLLGTVVASWHWRRVYKDVLRPCAKIVVSAKSQELALRSLGVEGSTYLPYPWPAKIPQDRKAAQPAVPTLLFIGTLEALGSRSAFHLLIDEIHPALVASFGSGGFRIIICGRGALADWVQRAIADKPEFEYRGFVEDIEGLMAQCHALLAPIDVPVGNRSRILTAWAQRLLVIAHRNTALGNPDLIDGQTGYLAASCDEFIDRIERAVRQPAHARAITGSAYEVYQKKFFPAAAVRLMLAEIEDALASRCRQTVVV